MVIRQRVEQVGEQGAMTGYSLTLSRGRQFMSFTLFICGLHEAAAQTTVGGLLSGLESRETSCQTAP